MVITRREENHGRWTDVAKNEEMIRWCCACTSYDLDCSSQSIAFHTIACLVCFSFTIRSRCHLSVCDTSARIVSLQSWSLLDCQDCGCKESSLCTCFCKSGITLSQVDGKPNTNYEWDFHVLPRTERSRTFTLRQTEYFWSRDLNSNLWSPVDVEIKWYCMKCLDNQVFFQTGWKLGVSTFVPSISIHKEIKACLVFTSAVCIDCSLDYNEHHCQQ